MNKVPSAKSDVQSAKKLTEISRCFKTCLVQYFQIIHSTSSRIQDYIHDTAYNALFKKKLEAITKNVAFTISGAIKGTSSE